MYALKTRRAFHGWKYLPSLTKTPKNRTTFFSTTCWKFISSKFRGSIPASHSDFNLSLPYPLSHSYNLPIEFLLFTFSSFLSLSIIGWNEINNSSSTMIQPLRRDDIFPSSKVSLKISSHPFQSFLLQPHFLLIIPFHPSLAVLRTDAKRQRGRNSSFLDVVDTESFGGRERKKVKSRGKGEEKLLYRRRGSARRFGQVQFSES